jgi:restriction system protein
MNPERSITAKRAAIFIKAAFEALDEAGGSLQLRDLLKAVETKVELTDYDRAIYEKSGYVRWQSVLHFYSIDCVKAGYLKKSRGMWYLTPEGKQVLPLPADAILQQAMAAYRIWRANQPLASADQTEIADRDEETTKVETVGRSLILEAADAQARQEIQEYIAALGPYEMQDLVAALLRGMGYHTPFIAPKGPDGGTDIIAYQDPLGTTRPHIRVQVKHRQNSNAKVTRAEIAELRGGIKPDREVGLFVSTAGFTPEALREARYGTVHIDTVDLDRLLELWTANYAKLSEEDKGLLRLRTVHFLSPD